MKNILITGSQSGFGKYLSSILKKNKNNKIYKLSRENKKKILNKNYKKKFHLIFHCAASRPIYNKIISKKKYFKDNVELTKKVLSINHSKFIYISTVDIYPEGLNNCHEKLKIKEKKITSIYAKTKFIAEKEVIKKKDYIIIRVGSIIGKTMKKNIIYKLLLNRIQNVPYSEKSEVNIISYKFLKNFILLLIKNKQIGIFNCANKKNQKIKCLSNKIKTFGNMDYFAPKTSLKKSKKFIELTLFKNKNFYSKKSLF
jgi:dTDP-4-dehydrorhamnose reductase